LRRTARRAKVKAMAKQEGVPEAVKLALSMRKPKT
jgi:SpoU rRNA methylase family enzyme